MLNDPLETMLPRGVKDFLPIKAAKIEYLEQALRQVFKQWGFRPVTPASLEYLHALERGLGVGLREKTFRFDDRQSGKLVAFSPDITPQVARIVATRMRELPLPLRLRYSGRILRHTEQQAGKDREIFQSGAELIGLDSPEADGEMIAMAASGLQAVGATQFSIDIGQVEFYRGVVANLDLDANQHAALQSAISHKDVSGLRELLETTTIDDRAKEEIIALPRLFGGREVLARAERVVTNDRSRRALDNLAQVLDSLDSYDIDDHITLDLGELRGLDYHSGITFQGFLGGMGREVCSGGRYDGLTARYGHPAPATGFTFNLLNLLFALDRELDGPAAAQTDLFIVTSGAGKNSSRELAHELRLKGYSVARELLERELENSLEYARKLNYRYVLIIEETSPQMRLISLADNSERQLTREDLFNGSVEL